MLILLYFVQARYAGMIQKVYAELDKQIREEGKPSEGKEFGLTAALDKVREKYGMYAFVPDGKSFDIGLPDTYRETMWQYCLQERA